MALIISIICSGCTTPAARVDAEAARLGFERQTVRGTLFPHRVYLKPLKTGSKTVHVYIEGDGTPWLLANLPSSDPTPRNPLMLRLMAQDPEPSLYLGRPCYFGFAETPPCKAWWWTDGRFAPEVVDSMAAALNRLRVQYQFNSVVLIGHSGGGALAVLLASRPIKADAIVTLAGNLDTDAWTQYHQFDALSGSLNPARMATLEKGITQLHFLGESDQIIPPVLLSRFATRQPQAHFKIYPEFDHHCCWEKEWSEILKMLSRFSNPMSVKAG